MKSRIVSVLVAAGFFSLGVSGSSAATLDEVKAKGFVMCGVSQGLPGFSHEKEGKWSGLDVDICRAIAAAIFGDGSAVKFTPLSARERFTALTSGEVDVLSRNTTWTMKHDASLGLNFGPTTFYDGQGFMVRKELGVNSTLELSGATVCTNIGTTSELNVRDYFQSNNMELNVLEFQKMDEALKAYEIDRCQVYTADSSGLHAQRLKLSYPDEHNILPEIISKEPLGPVVRQGDDQWFNIVKWAVFALINAEEMGISSANIDSMMDFEEPAVARFVGASGSLGDMIGLDNEWAANIIKQVGNYSEIFERNVGPNTDLEIPRGINALWSNGGIMYAPPLR